MRYNINLENLVMFKTNFKKLDYFKKVAAISELITMLKQNWQFFNFEVVAAPYTRNIFVLSENNANYWTQIKFLKKYCKNIIKNML